MAGENHKFRVASVGDLVADLIVTIPHLPVVPDVHQIVHQIKFEPGGAGNFLIAGSRLDMDMVALGTIGDDMFGSAIVDILDGQGVNVEGVLIQEDTGSTTVIVLVDDAGEHVFLGGYGVGPTISFPSQWKILIDGCSAVFASGYTFREQRLADAALSAMRYAQQIGVTVFFDPGPDMVHIPEEQVQEILSSSNILLLTMEEIHSVTGGEGGIDAVTSLLQAPVEMICVKRGAEGCIIYSTTGTIEHSGYDVQVRDTTAAGDSFAAAFIYAYLKSWSLEKIAAFSNAMGAAKVQKVGSGTQVPTAEEIRGVLKRFDVGLDF